MSKKANTSLAINPVLASRWSPRAFSNKEIDDRALIKMFEAARWAPSSMNDQPWHFIIGRKGEESYQKIFETLVEFNQLWAINAPVLVLCIGSIKRSDTASNPAYKYDTGQAVAHLSIQAMYDGIYVHQMGGFSEKKAAELFQIPEHYEALTVLAIGYLGNPDMLPLRMQKSENSERFRKPLHDFVFENKFGEIARFKDH